MKKQLIISLKAVGLMTLLLGVIYPLFITGIAQIAFHDKANGSLIEVNGVLKGSKLIGQKNDMDIYFNTRPSAVDYNTLASGASNFGLTSEELHNSFEQRKSEFSKKNNLAENTLLPSEMLFASASGIDPHISPEAASLQINRIANARKLSVTLKEELQELVNRLTEQPQFNLFGCPRINVFILNLELDKLK